MIAVIFEAWPAPHQREMYLGLAAALRNDLEAVDGFMGVERFQSLAEPTKLLSLSFWRDEAAVATWRAQAHHRSTQLRGRTGVFEDYRLRVASVVRDYGLTQRDEAPSDSRSWHMACPLGEPVQTK